MSDDDDLRNAFQKNLPVTNEQIDAFNRGERQFINEQLTLLTLKQEDIQQEMEKASLELMEDEDYKSMCETARGRGMACRNYSVLLFPRSLPAKKSYTIVPTANRGWEFLRGCYGDDRCPCHYCVLHWSMEGMFGPCSNMPSP